MKFLEGTDATDLVKVHFLPVPMLNKPIQVLQHKRPRLIRYTPCQNSPTVPASKRQRALTSRRLRREERQHVYVDRVNHVEHVLPAAALLVARRELADGDGDVQAGEVRLREHDLLRERVVRDRVVEQRLRAELQHARHELRLRVRVQQREDRVAARDPDQVSVEPELAEVSTGQGVWRGVGVEEVLTQMRACTPRAGRAGVISGGNAVHL